MSNLENRQRTQQFLHLLGEHEDRTKAFVFSLVPNYADAEDISQEVRLRLWDQFDCYDPAKDFGAWSRTIAYYVVLAFRKRSRRRQVGFGQEFLAAVAEEVNASAVELDARSRALESCLDKLDKGRRELLLRCYSGRESMRQIAEQIGRSFEAFRKSIFRMRTALAACIEQALAREAGN